MENLKKWFNFGDTISGTTFIGRWVVAMVVQFVGGYIVGTALATGMNMGVLTLGLIIASAGIALQFSTLLKRSRALFEKASASLAFYFAYLLVSITKGFVTGYDVVLDAFVGLTLLTLFGYAIFKNSGVPETGHLG